DRDADEAAPLRRSGDDDRESSDGRAQRRVRGSGGRRRRRSDGRDRARRRGDGEIRRRHDPRTRHELARVHTSNGESIRCTKEVTLLTTKNAEHAEHAECKNFQPDTQLSSNPWSFTRDAVLHVSADMKERLNAITETIIGAAI